MTHQRDQRRSLNSSWENELTKSRFNRFTFYHTLFLLLLLFLLHFFGFSSLLAPLRLSNKRKPAIARVGQKWAAKPTKHRQHGQQQQQRRLWQRPRLVAFAGQWHFKATTTTTAAIATERVRRRRRLRSCVACYRRRKVPEKMLTLHFYPVGQQQKQQRQN